MSRKGNEKISEAEKLFQDGERLVDIAHKLDIPEGTVRRWKSTYKWGSDNTERSVLKKSERSLSKSTKKKPKKESVVAEVEELCKNGELTDKQRLFCTYYVRCFNATKAYQKAYGCNYESARANATRMIANDSIKTEILNLKQNHLNRELIHGDDIFQKYMDIAFSDMTDYLDFGTKEISVVNETTGKPEKIKVSYLNIRDSDKVDGTLITEMSKIKGEIKVKLADRMQALKWLADHMDLATEEQRAKIAILKAKVQDGTQDDIADDGFIDALNGTAAEDWTDEED